MSYIVTKTDGTTLTTIIDGTRDNTSSSLVLIGRNYSNYGQILADDLVWLLENFSYETAPANPITGQLWWKRDSNLLNVYTGSGWKSVSSATSSSTSPSTTTPGDFWWDSLNQQLYVYNGTSPYNANAWVLIGPSFSVSRGKSGSVWETIRDTLNNNHNVLSVYLDGVRTGIISTDSVFTPNVAIAGFSTISTGYNIRSSDTLWGTSNNSNQLGGQLPSKYFRNDIDNITSGNIIVLSDSGVRLGSTQQLRITTSGSDASITNTISNGDIKIYANVAGTLTESIRIEGTTGEVILNQAPTSSLGVSTKGYVDAKFTDTTLSGTPVAPTPAGGDNTTKIATTAFVNTANVGLKAYFDSALSTTGANVALKANIASPTFTGIPKSVTPTGEDNSTNIATTEFVTTAITSLSGTTSSGLGLKANIASPTFTGVAQAVTMPSGTSNTAIATTEWVKSNSGLLANSIYQGNSNFTILDSGTGSANLSIDGSVVLTAIAGGVALTPGATAYTWPQTTSNTAIATTSYVRTAATKWDGAAKFVSSSAPDPSLGVNGDFWFQYQ
jgi:hypothetical protein